MAKQPSSTTEAGTLEKRQAELATLNADIAALTQAADDMEQTIIWAWNARCAAGDLSERDSNSKLYDGIEKLYNQSEALKADVDALLKSYKGALPTLTRLVESHTGNGKQEAKEGQRAETPTAAKKGRPTKAALVEEAKATLAAKENRAKKVVKPQARGRR